MRITGKALTAAVVMATALQTGPALAADQVAPRHLLTAAEVAEGSSREGWRAVDGSRGFDCGAVGVMRSSAASDRSRAYASDADASGFEYVASHESKRRAKAAFRRSAFAIRTCLASAGSVRIRTDEGLAAPGRNRLIELVFRRKCCGSDIHAFGLVRRGPMTAVVKIGELGVRPSGPMAEVVLRAGERLRG